MSESLVDRVMRILHRRDPTDLVPRNWDALQPQTKEMYRYTAQRCIEEVADAIDEAYERGERVAGWSTNDPDVKTHAAHYLRAQAREDG